MINIHGSFRRVAISCRWRLLLPVFACWLAAGAVPAAAQDPGDEAAAWPLDLPEHFLTSNFMEYRPGRFHAGLDFKTRSQSGFPVHAVEDGWISRVRATPGAYGRAVYLRGESGRTYVYAHLSRFNDALRERLAAARGADGRYRVRVTMQPGEMPVRRGDVLGLSGQSGTGGPHLHFEVRDEGQRPLDPQSCGFAVTDTFPPVIHHVRALPAAPDAFVMGANTAMLHEGGAVRLEPLVIEGPVAFSARITDQADIRGHVLEPALLEVYLDGVLVYRSENEGFAFDEVAQQRLEWLVVPQHDDSPAIRERWLHRRAAVQLDGRAGGRWYLGSDGHGLAPGAHEIRLVAQDHAGGRTQTRIPLVVAARGLGPRDEEPQATVGGWCSEPVELTAPSTGTRTGYRLTPFFAEIPPGWDRIDLAPERGDPVLAATVVIREEAEFAPAQDEACAEQGLKGARRQTRYVAADWPLDAALTVDLAASVPDSASRTGLGLYRWHRDHWVYEGEPLLAGPDGVVGARINAPGEYALLQDETAPRIGAADTLTCAPGPVSDVAGVTLPRWEVLAVPVADPGAGVAAATVTARLDGEPLILEPDLIRDRLLVELPPDTPGGDHRLEIEAADEAGNTAAREFLVLCRKNSP